MAALEHLTLKGNGLNLHAVAQGKGPAVLLVHGWGGHAGQMLPLARALRAQGLRPVLVELPQGDALEYPTSHIGRALQEQQQGKPWLRAFHDAFLSHGAAPFWALRRLMLDGHADDVLE